MQAQGVQSDLVLTDQEQFEVWAGVRLGNVIHFFETLRIEGQL